MPRYSINTKIMLVQLFMAMLGAVALAIFGYIILYTSLMACQREKIEYVATSWASLIGQRFANEISKTERLGKSEAVASYPKALSKESLFEYFKTESSKSLPEVAYLNKNGLEELKVIHGLNARHLFDHGRSLLFRQAKAHPNRVLYKIFTKTDHENGLSPPYIEFIYYSENQGDFTGAVMVRTTINLLTPELSTFHFDHSGFVALLSKEGTILSHPDRRSILRKINLDVFPGLGQLGHGKSLFMRASVLGQDEYTAIVSLPKLGLFVNAALPHQQFLAIPNKLIFIYLAILFLTMSLCLAVSLLLAKGITRPILDLVVVSNRLAQGDWHQRIDTSSADEIGVLAKSFLVMKNRLHDMILSRDQEIQARKKSEERYRTLFDSAPDAISILDREGMVLDVNPACCELYGMGRKELIGQPSLNFVVRQNWEICRLNFEKLKEKQVDVEEEIAILYGVEKCQRPVWRKARALQDEDGLFNGVLIHDRDISCRKEAERLQEDLDRIARHDLKAPLNGIINVPQLIRSGKNLSYDQLRWLQMIEDSGYKMLDMINSSLDLYRMEEGTYDFQPVRVDCVAIFHKISLDLLDRMQAKGTELKIYLAGQPIDEKAVYIVPGDELLCYSMLANLVKNALEASPTGQAIEVFLESNGKYEIAIHNFGLVPSELKNCFFAKYATAGKKSGTGLGTYSAMLMARTQKGDITMRSSSKEGTFVTVSFPKEA